MGPLAVAVKFTTPESQREFPDAVGAAGTVLIIACTVFLVVVHAPLLAST